jgi:plasmid stabilization system protein ParE
MPRAQRTEAAEQDLRDIAFHVAVIDNRPLAADRIIDELIEKADTLARLSGSSVMGTACPEIGRGVRLFSHKRWVILFRYEPHGVDVLRFADASQDYLSWKL